MTLWSCVAEYGCIASAVVILGTSATTDLCGGAAVESGEGDAGSSAVMTFSWDSSIAVDCAGLRLEHSSVVVVAGVSVRSGSTMS